MEDDVYIPKESRRARVWLKAKHVAELLDVTEATVYNRCKSGKLPHYLFAPNSFRFRPDEIERHIKDSRANCK
jgi:predicted site-specific integrase-resolvase